MLDLFAGLGGASSAMRERGWEVTTVDIEPAFEPDVVADMRAFTWSGGPVDLLWASPPCDEFAKESMPWCRTGLPPRLDLVDAVYRLVREIRPRHWIIENVKGAQRWIGPAAWVRNPIYLWGVFPFIEHGPIEPWKERLSSTQAAERAKIPYSLSVAVAEAVEQGDRQGSLAL